MAAGSGFEQGVLWEASADGFVVVDGDGTIRAVNPEATRLFGWSADALVGQPIEVLVPASERNTHVALRGRYAVQPTSRPMALGSFLDALRKDGTVFPAQISLTVLDEGGEALVLAAVRDATKWFEADRALTEARRQRGIAEDRERIGADLHDTVIQQLFGIGMGLQSVVAGVPDGAARERVESSIDAIDGVIRELRATIFGLSNQVPSAGLTAASAETIADLTPLLGFAPRLDCLGPLDSAVPAEIASHVVPVLREALTNVAKHADATTVSVRIAATDRLEIEVTDDGRGPGLAPRRGSGLENLARRAGLLGGRLVVEPALYGGAAGGTRVLWSVPLARPGMDRGHSDG